MQSEADSQGQERLLDVAVILVNDGYASTAVGPIEVFSAAGRMWNEMSGQPVDSRFRVTMASIDGAPIESAYGLTIIPHTDLDGIGEADLVFVSASGPVPSDWIDRHAPVVSCLRRYHERGAMLAGVCSGVAFLAESGLLDGRRATTHWGIAEDFHQRYPRVDWQSDMLITEDGGMYCGGGVNAATDLSLFLVERLCGRQTAIECAKALILDMPRQYQSRYAILPISRNHDDSSVRRAEEYLHAHCGEHGVIEQAATIAAMSVRTPARRFKQATGLSPGQYLQKVRVAAARQLLEDGERSVQRAGARVGYEDTAFFRRVFVRHCGMTPSAYRDRFRSRQSLPR